MPIENLEEEGLEKNPDLHLAQCKFLLTLPEFKNDRATHQKISEGIKKDGKMFVCMTCNFTRIFLVMLNCVNISLRLYYLRKIFLLNNF